MRVMLVNDVKKLEHKEVIPSLRGTITKLYDYKTGEGEHGRYSFQNGEFKDESGAMKVVFSNQQDMKGFLNREVTIQSYSGDKGLSGIYANDNTYNGKTTREIKVTSTADIALIDGSSRASEAPRARSNAGGGSGQPGDLNEYKRSLGKVLNAIYTNYLSLEKLRVGLAEEGIELTEEQVQAAAATAIIHLDRKGMIDSLPEEPIWEKKVPVTSGAERAATEEDDEIPF